MVIADLTKKELLEIIAMRGLIRSVSDADINTVRWRTMIRKAKKVADEAIVEMKIHKGPQNYPKFKQAMDKFDRAMELYDEANKFFRKGGK